VSSKGVNIIFMFFCLDAKEPKGQEVAKLLPHAARWPAATPAYRAYLY